MPFLGMRLSKEKNYQVVLSAKNKILAVKETEDEEGVYKANPKKRTKRREVAPGRYIYNYFEYYPKKPTEQNVAEAIRGWVAHVMLPKTNQKKAPNF